ncbi:MAG TPA: hypothetical protein VFR23_04100 [Jiangellaceae bacterium]|nr:hypothetical protein [Jiangellaceae bacterium]
MSDDYPEPIRWHYRECPAWGSTDMDDCECYEIEMEMRAEWIDDGAPDDWRWP